MTAEYVHGVSPEERERLSTLNHLTNAPFLKFLQVTRDDRVLEVGSGLGVLAEEVSKRGAKFVVGAEYAFEQLTVARSRVSKSLEFVLADAHYLPFKDLSFDVVYCRYVLEHLEKPSAALSEMRRVLRPGGRVYLQENDTLLTVFDPDCPAAESLVKAFVKLQARLGGDGRIGKRLFGLLFHAGFRDIEVSLQPELHTANLATYSIWIDNIIKILTTAAVQMVAFSLATDVDVAAAMAELEHLKARPDGSALFHWNRAYGIK